MNRRSFLPAAGLAAFAVASGLARATIEVKRVAWVLVGDGVTDDTGALQAALDGEDVFDSSGKLVSTGGVVHLPRGATRITRTLELQSNSALLGGTIKSEAPDYVLKVGEVTNVLLKDLRFDR